MNEFRNKLIVILYTLFLGHHLPLGIPPAGPVGNPLTEATPKKISNHYYISRPWPDHSAYGLELAVGKGFVTPYQAEIFDCSNLASFLQWKLKKLGFDAKICISTILKAFHNKGASHAWVAVSNPVDDKIERFYVESTAHDVGSSIIR